MSFFGSAKEFFGLGLYNGDEDGYYDDSRYDEREERYDAAPSRQAAREGHDVRESRAYREPVARDFVPAVVSTSPRTYNDAKDIGEPFRDGDAVIMELTDLNPADAKRIVDFAAGLCFALRGNMFNLSKGIDTRRRVFAIVPENARLTEIELQHTARLR